MAAGGDHGPHQQRDTAFAQRLGQGQRLQCCNRLRGPADRQQRVAVLLRCPGPQLVQPRDFRMQRGMVELRVGPPPPQPLTRFQPRQAQVRVGHHRGGRQVVGVRRDVHGGAVGVELVALRRSQDPDPRRQQRAEPGDIGLHGRGGVGRRGVPHELGEQVSTERGADVRDEGREQPPLPCGSDGNRSLGATEQPRSEDADRRHALIVTNLMSNR